MKRLIIPVIALSALLFISCGKAPPPAEESRDIRIDGLFSDWREIEAVYPPSGPVREVRMVDSPGRFFFQIVLADEITLQSENSLVLYLDTDNDSSTGIPVGGIGADFSWRFGQREGRLRLPKEEHSLNAYDLGLVAAPVVTSRRFEIGLNKKADLLNGDFLFSSPKIRWVLIDESARTGPEEIAAGGYTFQNRPRPSYPDVPIASPSEESVRIVSYNVLWDGLFSRPQPYRRILRALNPDLISFQEIGSHGSGEVRALVEEMLGGEWEAAGYSDVVTVSRYPIAATGSSNGNLAVLIDLPDSKYKKDLLVINAHLPFGPHHQSRREEIEALLDFIRDVKNGEGPIPVSDGTPIVLVGDMNLVGPASQLGALIRGLEKGPDWDGSPLTDLRVYHNSAPRAYTWQSSHRSGFGPSRLDYIFYTDSVLTPVNGFILATESMEESALEKWGLRRSDSIEASDHYPLVVDFEI